MTKRFYEFSEIDKFLCYYSPKSPYGRNEKEEEAFYCETDKLNGIFDRIEQMISFVERYPQKADKIEYHLMRLPELNPNIADGNIRSELFNVKKFLHNYKQISHEFEIDFYSEELLKSLGHEDSQEESFYLKDDYSADLSRVRKQLREINSQLNKSKEKRVGEIHEATDLDFRFLNFLIIKENEIPPNSDSFIFLEQHDKSSVMVKPIFGKEFFLIHNLRKELLESEAGIESEILQMLKKQIIVEQEKLNTYIQTIIDLDTSMAKARLAIQFHCIRPRVTLLENLEFEDLEFIPLKEKSTRAKRIYTSLSVSFNEKNNVVTGSNMGGKTILLKTIAFSQLLVQQGFFVPARKISAPLFDSLNLIGMVNEDSNSGLSSFGEEILNLLETGKVGTRLYLVDEFARTTNSREAFALNCALLQWFAEQETVFSVTSTHLDQLPNFKCLSYWTMKGLDYEKYRLYYHRDKNRDLNERINLINNYMDYSVKPLVKSEVQKDALKIADILGLDSEIIKNAEKYLKNEEYNHGE